MIEAPEARIIARQLDGKLKGKVITEVVTQFSPHKFAWFYGDHNSYPGWLTGKEIGGARSYGGIVQTEVGGEKILFSDGVNFRVIPPGDKLPRKHQLLLGFEDESALVVSVRMYGGIFYLPQKPEEFGYLPYYEAAKNKPQVLSRDFTLEYFMSLFRLPDAAKKSAKAFLATGQNIPGLGNGVLQDILYRAGVNPKTRVDVLEPGKREILYDSVVHVLSEMTAMGGRNSESDIYGKPGGYIPVLSCGTAGKPCPRCGEFIVKEAYLGGSVYYCPGCQPRKSR